MNNQVILSRSIERAPLVSIAAKREGRGNKAQRPLFKFFVWSFYDNKYLPVSGLHLANYAESLNTGEIFFKIPFFLTKI